MICVPRHEPWIEPPVYVVHPLGQSSAVGENQTEPSSNLPGAIIEALSVWRNSPISSSKTWNEQETQQVGSSCAVRWKRDPTVEHEIAIAVTSQKSLVSETNINMWQKLGHIRYPEEKTTLVDF